MSCSILLIVADDAAREVIQRVLANSTVERFLCTTTATTAEGLHYWESAQSSEAPFDLVLLEWGLPDETMLPFLYTLQGQAEIPPLPIIILVDQDHQQAAQATLAVGVQDVIAKAQAFSTELPGLLTKAIARFALVQRLHTMATHFQDSANEAHDGALQATHTRIQNILESITDAFYTLDREWRITYINPQAERYFRRSKAELLGRRLWDLFPGAIGSLFDERYRQVMAEGVAVHFEGLSPVIGRWLEVHAYPSSDGLTIYFRDVTSRREAEAVLFERARQQAAVANLGQRALEIQELQLLMDETVQLVTETLSVEYCKLLERLPSGESLLLRAGSGWRTGYVGHTLVSAGAHSQAGYALLQAEPVIVTDLSMETRFQSPALLHEHDVISGISCIIADQPGQPYGVLGAHTTSLRIFTIDDVNFLQAVANILSQAIQRQRVENRLRELNATLEQRVLERTADLERSNQELDRFAHIAAHDLQAPLRGIDQLATWITEDASAVLPAPSQVHLDKLLGRIKRMRRLLDDLLAYAQATRKNHLLEWVDTLQLVQGVVDLLAPPPGLRITIEEPMPRLRTERTPLETVVRNLVSNAIKHHHRPSAGQITITAQVEDSWVTFSVRDDGPGIDAQFHERIFQLFQTLQPRDKVEGSGLGLALVQRLVEHRGGSVGVASTLGQGALFYFTWPNEPSG